MIDYSFSFYDLECFLLILVRVSCFFFNAPFFSMSSTPRRVRIGLAIFVSLLLYQSLTPLQLTGWDTLLEYSLVVIKEVMVGLLMGFSCSICNSILAFAGQIADMEIGLTMVQILDPSSKEMVSVSGNLYNYAFMMMLIANGMYRYLLGALADTFELIPLTGAIIDSEHLLQSMTVFLGDYVLLGFRIILPIFASILMLNAILGIIAKVSPQMNMFSIGIQLKILTGIGVLLLTVSLMPQASDMIYTEMKKMMVLFVSSLS